MADAPVVVSDTLMSVSDFRAFFPAFRDPQVYVDGELEQWLAIADQILTPARWPSPYRTMGMALYAAHNLVLSKRDEKQADAGRIPGSPTGIQTSKSLGGASVSYDTSSAMMQGAGQWNLTSYGTRFYQLMRIIGMGGTQSGGPDWGPGFNQAWPGVIYPRF